MEKKLPDAITQASEGFEQPHAEAHVPGRGAVWPHLAHTILVVYEAVRPLTHAMVG